MKMIETAGYPPNAIEVEAFQLALPALAPIERLIVSAQKRLDRYLEDLERTSKAHARALSVAAEKAIAENAATGVTKVSGMAQIAANQRNGAKRREGTQARRYRKVEPAQVPRDKGWIAVPQLRRSASPILVWHRGRLEREHSIGALYKTASDLLCRVRG